MLLRRTIPLAIAFLAIACEPSVPYNPASNPAYIDYGGFDPTASPPVLPLPNALALTDGAILAQNPTQAAFLRTLVAQGGFPNDQEVDITIDFQRFNIDPGTGAVTKGAPPLDLSTINGSTLLVLAISSLGGLSSVAYDAPQAADYVVGSDRGTLTLRKSVNPKTGSRRWDPATYVVAVRGGPSGVQVKNSAAGLKPQAAMYLLEACTPTCANGKGLTDPSNQGLIPGNSRQEKATTAITLEILRKSYLYPFDSINRTGVFKHNEVATLGVFKVADVVTHVETDPGAGLMPLPSDFLSGPDGKLLPQLTSPNGPFGPLGPGLGTLDGFSTTAMILSQTSGPIIASSVNKNTVFLYELGGTPSAPTATRMAEVNEGAAARFVAEPSAITQVPPGGSTALSTAIGLQPAVPARTSAGGPAFLPPLKESTSYVVLVTDGVKDINNIGISRSTLGQILLLAPTLPLAVAGKSQLAGVSDAQAVGLDQMRGAINLAAGTLAVEKPAVTRDHIVMAYTFHTQSITGAAVNLGALPYLPACSATVTSKCFPPAAAAALKVPVAGTTAIYCKAQPFCPGQTMAGTILDVYNKYGADPGTIPNGNLGAIVESLIVTPNPLNPANGAFNPDPTQIAFEPIPVIISVPKPPIGPGNCIPGPGAPCVVPLVVFRHGVNGNRASMLLVADRFANAGFAVAAIDAVKHGARSYCHSVTNAECLTTCQPCVAGSSCGDLSKQGDTPATGGTPGKCAGGTPANGGNFVNAPVQCPSTTGCPTAIANAGTPVASGNYFVSANLFRTRDSLRQDIIDQSQLVQVVAVNPLAPPAGADIFTAIASTGVVIDPTKIYFVGQSLGGMQGDADVAANPRFTKALFNVSGETIVDTYTNAPALAPNINALLATLKITPGTAAYLQFVNVAKWILDPGEPANFSDHLTRNTLPNLLTGAPTPPAQAPKKILGQLASCDGTVPNPFNMLQFKHIGLGPDDASVGTLTTFVSAGTASADCPGGIVHHGFFGDWVTYGQTNTSITQLAQDDAASFFAADIHPPNMRVAP
jgi:hypothetical protein